MRRLLAIALLAASAAPAAERFELRGALEGAAAARVAVTLSGVDTAYRGRTETANARFRFKDLAAGTYTLVVFDPRQGETRRTVAVNRETADARGRLELRIPVGESTAQRERALLRASVVSAAELTVPGKALAAHRKGRAALGRGDADAAERQFRRAVELAPQFADAWNELGVISNLRKQFPLAEERFRRALEADPEAFEPLVNLGGVLIPQRKFAEAIEINRRALEARPDDALAHAQLGIAHFLLGEDGPALRYLSEARRLDPAHFTHPQTFLAEIHIRRGRPEAAALALEELARLHAGTEAAERARAAASKLRERLGNSPP